MKTYTQACRERAERVECWGWDEADEDKLMLYEQNLELCRRLDRAVEALREQAFGYSTPECAKELYALADELERP